MKRIISILLTVVLALSCLALASCSKKDAGTAPTADSPYIGTWKATRGELKGESTPIEEILDSDTFVIELKEDGTAIIDSSEQETCTWTETKDGINVKAGDGELKFIATDGNLAMKVLNARIIFEKQ